jgi:tetratricopeptide (TPR) repeat protein
VSTSSQSGSASRRQPAGATVSLPDSFSDLVGLDAEIGALARDLGRGTDEVRPLASFDPSEGTWSPFRIGRYTAIRRIGAGGMGVVYGAYDDELDRKVAIKIVRRVDDGDAAAATARMRREAQALAKLSHPNVLAVHEVGFHDGATTPASNDGDARSPVASGSFVFIVMEFVVGQTLREWWSTSPRSWREQLDAIVQVGRGLAAVHRAGLVHRDVKPENVMIDGSGRVRLMDFGLARAAWDPGLETLGGGHSDPLATPALSRSGALVGTPAYMAPEQFDGPDVGPAADQFALGVMAWEGFFGERPYAGDTLAKLRGNVIQGVRREPARPRVIPVHVRRALERAVATTPGERWPDVDALLRAITPRARGPWWFAAAAGTLALGVGFRAALAVTPEPCAAADDDALPWGAAAREAVRTGMGPDTGDAAIAALDRWVESYGAKRHEVCEATRVEGVQSDAAMGLRMACLDRIAGRFAGLTDELADAGNTAAAPLRPDELDAQLPALDGCDDVETLTKLSNRHAARSSRSSVEQDRAWALAVEQVERALVRRRLGRADAREPAERAVALATEHDLPGVHARALSVLADLELDAGRGPEAERLRREAVRFAVADGNDDAVVYFVLDGADAALQADRVDEAELHLGYFDAFVDRMTDAGARDDVLARAEIVRARLSLVRGDADDALRRLSALPIDAMSELDRRAAWMAMGVALRAVGRDAEASATWTRLLGLVEAMRGADHPDVAAVLNNLALVHLDAGDPAAARPLLQRAEAIVTAGPDAERDPMRATLATNLGWTARLEHRHDEARTQLERALAIGRATRGDRHPAQAYALDQLGALERELGHFDAALERYAAAGELRDATLGANHPETATTLLGMARVFLAKGDRDQASAASGAARGIVEARGGSPKLRRELDALAAEITEP